MPLGPSLVVLVLLILFATLPIWPYSRIWGYRPTIFLGILFTLFVVLWAVQIV